MEDYLIALRSRDNTPAPLLSMDKEHEEQMINNYRAEMEAKIKEKEAERMEEKKERIDERKEEKGSTSSPTVASKIPAIPATHDKTLKVEVHATAVHHEADAEATPHSDHKPQAVVQHQEATVVHHLEPKVAHAQSHDFSHNQATYSVRRVDMSENRSVYVTLGFAGVALMVAMIIGMVVLKKRNGRHPHHQGFIEVDTAASPEEKHVASMQINGYENPTYKYFEASTA